MRAVDRCCHILACKKVYGSPARRRQRPGGRPRWYARKIRRATWSTTMRWSNALRRSVSRRRDNCAPPVTARSIIVWVVPARTTAVIAGVVIAGAVHRTTGQYRQRRQADRDRQVDFQSSVHCLTSCVPDAAGSSGNTQWMKPIGAPIGSATIARSPFSIAVSGAINVVAPRRTAAAVVFATSLTRTYATQLGWSPELGISYVTPARAQPCFDST